MTRTVLILAGGAGTRLWPLSTDESPKQFLRIFNGTSLLQKTCDRLSVLVDPSAIFVSTNDRYRSMVVEQLPAVPQENILVEPARRNTGPAIAACMAQIERRLGDTTVGIFPSDHLVGDEREFVRIVALALDHAAENDHLVTIGITPTSPETGYGYLDLGDAIDDGALPVKRFIEKPPLDRARELIATGKVAWNGGMFLWRTSTFRHGLASAAPDIEAAAAQYAATDDPDAQRAIYESMRPTSIDYALMEKATNVVTFRGDFDWSDVGSWGAIARYATSDPRVITEAGEENFVITDRDTPVVTAGVSGLVIVESEHGLLVLDPSRSEALAAIVKRLPKA